MRTTISIDDELLERAKKAAKRRGQTLGQYVESTIRKDLATPKSASSSIELPVFTRGTGMRPGIDPSSIRSLYDALEATDDPVGSFAE